ncbi:hypothetical protein [Pseudomonas sp. NFACC46-3]|uniref:hypothetical protein n=1 Tax=Pseudomonas sp. NFACC46-3 TaxID=1566200 RepID=UPI0008EBC09E|nr:hypothetical protein [Pseudomonas sp. NFACC46-3]SFL70522.1 hypothetical protein SAMN03159307_03880 [Pseudomonas sp. NFACC46-3]
MFKVTPNPPETDPSSAHTGLDPQKLDEAAERALSFYLDPKPQTKKKQPPGQLFTVVDDLDSECLLANLSETLAMPLEEQLGRPLNPTLYTPQDWAAKFAAGNSFVVRVARQDKISLLGEDAFDRV